MTALFRFPSCSTASSICTIGNFDGLHLGHQALIRELVEKAKRESLRSVVVSFYPHPLKVLREGFDAEYITSLRTRLRVLGDLGVDLLYLVRFTEQIASLSPEAFLDSILKEKLGCSSLFIGPDLCIGKNRAGTPAVLEQLSEARGWGFQVCSPVADDEGKKIGSRQIRELLNQGDVEAATKLLGRPMVVEGRVVHGESRGRGLGFRTANIHQRSYPPLALGVYAGVASVAGESIHAVTNIGVRPTFGGKQVTVETHLLTDKNIDCYGKLMRVSLLHFLREEKKFDSPELLRAQIAQDVATAKELLE